MNYDFSRFSDKARKVIKLADQRAKSLYHEYIGTEHLLLALMDGDVGPVIVCALYKFKVVPQDVQYKTCDIIQAGPFLPAPNHQLPFSPQSQLVFEQAMSFARNLQSPLVVGAEHLFWALLHDPESVATNVLTQLCGKAEDLQQVVLDFCKGKYNRELLDTMSVPDQKLLMDISAVMIKYYEHHADAKKTVAEIKSIVK